jgi:hypothetical protein
MDFSKLSAGDRRILIVTLGVIIGGVVSVIDRWGFGGIVGLLAGLGVAGVILQPQLAPAMKLPAPKATLVLILAGVAAIGFVVSALQYLSFVFEITRIYTLLFDLGLIAALALAYLAWLDYKAGQGVSAAPPPPAA